MKAWPRRFQSRADYLRASLFRLYGMRDAAEAGRAALVDPTLRERIAWASTIASIDGWIANHRRELARIARRGGAGVASGCRGGAPAVDGPWMARSAPAVGPAAARQPAVDITTDGDPLFAASGRQELPWNINPSDTHQTEGNQPC